MGTFYTVCLLCCLFYKIGGCDDNQNKNNLNNDYGKTKRDVAQSKKDKVIKAQHQENKVIREDPINIYFKKDYKTYDNVQEYADTLITNDMLEKKDDNIITKKVKHESILRATDSNIVLNRMNTVIEFTWREDNVQSVITSHTLPKTYQVEHVTPLSHEQFKKIDSKFHLVKHQTSLSNLVGNLSTYKKEKITFSYSFGLRFNFSQLNDEEIKKFKDGDRIRVVFKTIYDRGIEQLVYEYISYDILPPTQT